MTDIVLLQSQLLSDAANGGGQMTGTVVPDNQANNLFSNISREDRTAGRVNLRKAFVMATSADTKTYLGVHAIMSAPPTDPDVAGLLFTTNSWTDVRTDARNFIESYLVQGPALQAWMYGNQTIGQRSILIYQRPERPLPSIGDVLCLQDTTTTPNNIQYVRIANISSVVETFTDSVGDYQLNVITISLGSALETGFTGAEPSRYTVPHSPTLICQTNVADAAKYYGITQPTSDIASGALTGTVNGIYGQLVPATQAESPISLVSPTGTSSIVASGPAYSETFSPTPNSPIFLERGVFPKSLVFSNNGGTKTDDGKGNVINSAGAIVGTVDYDRGLLTPTNTTGADWSGTSWTISYIPAVTVTQSPFTQQQPITEGTRGYVYTATLNPLPSPGSTVVSYRALGKWYDLTDDGSGALVGADGTGGGAVRFDSGALSVTLGALPDIDSNLVIAWGQGVQYDQRATDSTIQIPAVALTLSNPAKLGTAVITWSAGGVTKTATDSGTGTLTGDATGNIACGAGIVTLRPNLLPDPAQGFSVAYTTNPGTTQTLTPSKTGSDLNFTLPSAPIAPQSVVINYTLTPPNGVYIYGTGDIPRVIHDDGAGGLIDSTYGPISGSSVNYTTGQVSFNPDLLYETNGPSYATSIINFWIQSSLSWSTSAAAEQVGQNSGAATAVFVNGSTVTVSSAPASASGSSHTDNFAAPPILLDLTPQTQEPIVVGGVCFKFAGDIYIDRSGSLYRQINHSTGAGILAGSLNYTTGQATITNWISGTAPTLQTIGLLCQFGTLPVGFVDDRAPGQSLRQASFYIQAVRASDNTLISATADSNGNFTTTAMSGHVDVTSGFFSVAFGQSVLDSSLTTDQKAQPWYNAANVDSTGHIWNPSPALPGTIKYSCVVETFLPLDPTILGIDPVRLPLDGRVQIIRPGDTLVFRNPLTFALPNPVTASATYTMPRTGLEDIVLYDSEGAAVDPSQYTTNPAAGTVTMASTLSLGAYTQPLIATHTQADMVLCTDAEINGAITWNRALTNAYPAASSYVSAALVAGDLQAGSSNLFAQETWDINPLTTWLDIFQGSQPTSAYNAVSYPIEVLDRDAITMRWALIFTSSTGGNIAAETLGVIGTFTTSANVAPINPATGNPYFVMDYHGFGGGWSIGNAIRFNTNGCGQPIWFVRTTLAGAAASLSDSFSTQIRWDE